MTQSSEAFFINKLSSMSFNELGEYIAMCFECLENPQKHLANAEKIPVLKETYDGLIERLESKLTRIDNLIYCKNEFESFGPFETLGVITADFDTLVNYHRKTEDDKSNIEAKIQLKRQKINELLLLLLKSSLSENKTALIFLNSSEALHKIIDLLFRLSESNKEVEKIIVDNRIKDFQKLLSEKYQFSNADYNYKRINEWNNVNESEINLREDFVFFVTRGLGVHFTKKFFKSSRIYWNQFFRDMDYELLYAKRYKKSKDSSYLEFKKRVHRIFRFEFCDKSLNKKNVNIIEEICSEKIFEKQIDKLLELEKSISNFLNKQNTDTEVINKLFDEYKSKRNEYSSNVNTALETLLENIIHQINSEIEKYIQLEKIDPHLEYSKEVVDHLKDSKNRIFAGSKQKMVVKEIFWDLLPQGEWKTEGLIKTFKGYGWSKDEFDESRLTQIIKILKPTSCYIGKEKFQGYVVFGFDLSEKVVLECPKYGNAIYVIEDDWQEITKLSKWEARQLSQVTVIRHSNTWFERLKENLESKY